jgi:hypothetical protein
LRSLTDPREALEPLLARTERLGNRIAASVLATRCS